MSRKKIPKSTEISVLDKSRRRCALCLYLEYDFDFKRGQLVHIDRDAQNNNEDNLAYLCMPHHDEYDSVRSQSKNFKPEELKKAKSDLEEFLADKSNLKFFNKHNQVKSSNSHDYPGVSIDVYKIRLPIYQAFCKFVFSIISEARVTIEELNPYLQKTKDAAFLYDEEMDDYLHEVHIKARKLRSNRLKMEHPDGPRDEKWEEWVNQETEYLMWFEEQIKNSREKFIKYLRIANI